MSVGGLLSRFRARRDVPREAPEPGAGALVVSDLRSGYGPLTVLQGVSLEVGRGELVAVLGANGAGKTTLLQTISGEVPVSSGQVWFDGQPLGGLAPHQALRLGVAHVLEGRQVFAHLTVRDNLHLGRGPAIEGTEDRLETILERFPVLRTKLDDLAGSLSGGQQQMLAICRAVMSQPKILLLDEPSLGLAPVILETVAETIRWLQDSYGTAVLLVEQHTTFALQLASRCYVMASGRVVREGPAAELRADRELMQAFIGTPTQEDAPTQRRQAP